MKSGTPINTDYKGKEVKLFSNQKNWFPWQRKLYTLIQGNNNILESDDHSIIFVVHQH